MIQFNKKIAIVFALISSYSVFGFAADVASDFPTAFTANYHLLATGHVSSNPGSKLDSSDEIFERSQKDGDLSWAVKSSPCAQNKSYQCVGIYKKGSSKILGNQMNPFNPVLTDSGFTLLRINPENGDKNSVIKCNSKFTQNFTRDEVNLANCVEYSKSICKKWTDYISQNSAEFTKVFDKVAECTDVMKSVDKFKVVLRNTFQGEIKQSEKDISGAFDGAAHPDRKTTGFGTKAQLSQSELSPHISTYKDILDRTADCSKYEGFFDKGFSGTGKNTSMTLPQGKLYRESTEKPAKAKQ